MSSLCVAQTVVGCWPATTSGGRLILRALNNTDQLVSTCFVFHGRSCGTAQGKQGESMAFGSQARQRVPFAAAKAKMGECHRHRHSHQRARSGQVRQVSLAYLHDGPGALFSAATISPPAPSNVPLLPRHACCSAALLIAGSRRPRWTLLGGDRGDCWW